eukprot:jgi/Bigna1/90266/estExt_fgenesh1_pg.C_660064
MGQEGWGTLRNVPVRFARKEVRGQGHGMGAAYAGSIGTHSREEHDPKNTLNVQDTLDIRLSEVVVPAFLKAHNWVKDEARNTCAHCRRSFNLYWRKHHCRICGDIFCDVCSRFKVLTALHPTMPARSCFACYDKSAVGDAQKHLDNDPTQSSLIARPNNSDGKVDEGSENGGISAADVASAKNSDNASVDDNYGDDGKEEGGSMALQHHHHHTLRRLYRKRRSNNKGRGRAAEDMLVTYLLIIIGDFGVVSILVAAMMIWLSILTLLWRYSDTVSLHTGIRIAEGFWHGCFVGVFAGSLAFTLTLILLLVAIQRSNMRKKAAVRAAAEAARSPSSSSTENAGAQPGSFFSIFLDRLRGLFERMKRRRKSIRMQDGVNNGRTVAAGDVKRLPGDDDDDEEKKDGKEDNGGVMEEESQEEEEEEEEEELTEEEERWVIAGEKAVDEIWSWTLSNKGWKLKTGEAASAVRVWQREKAVGGVKAFKAMGLVNASAQKLFYLLSDVKATTSWNKSLTEYSRSEAFRRCGRDPCGRSSSWTHISEGLRAGFGYTNGYVILEGKGDGDPVADENWCRLVWVVNADLKGWLPASVVATSLTSIMAGFYETDLKAGISLNIEPAATDFPLAVSDAKYPRPGRKKKGTATKRGNNTANSSISSSDGSSSSSSNSRSSKKAEVKHSKKERKSSISIHSSSFTIDSLHTPTEKQRQQHVGRRKQTSSSSSSMNQLAPNKEKLLMKGDDLFEESYMSSQNGVSSKSSNPIAFDSVKNGHHFSPEDALFGRSSVAMKRTKSPTEITLRSRRQNSSSQWDGSLRSRAKSR